MDTKEKVKKRILEYIEVGFVFDIYHVFIDTSELKKGNFDARVDACIALSDMIEIANAVEGEDDESYSAQWYAQKDGWIGQEDNSYVQDMRYEAKLLKRTDRYEYYDPLLRELQAEEKKKLHTDDVYDIAKRFTDLLDHPPLEDDLVDRKQLDLRPTLPSHDDDLEESVESSRPSVPETVIKTFEELGHEQRGKPELAMLKVQRAYGGGVLNGAVEHTGDLIHRMSHLTRKGIFDYDIGNKVTRVLNLLRSPYGFKREMDENMVVNAKYFNIPLGEMIERVDRALHLYYVEHSKLPVYNEAQWHAREASKALGKQNWQGAERHLSALEKMVHSPEGFNYYASQYTLGPNGEVEEYRG